MKENPHHPDHQQIQELLKQYENLKLGKTYSFLEEDAFEKIISYFDESDDLTKALEAANLAIERYPYSSALLIKKADVLLSKRQYKQAMEVLEQASLFDSSDI